MCLVKKLFANNLMQFETKRFFVRVAQGNASQLDQDRQSNHQAGHSQGDQSQLQGHQLPPPSQLQHTAPFPDPSAIGTAWSSYISRDP
jgi:hypothetical protein